ncbi:hypothetical protein BS50DRAFT_135116 [Corynespora cassiicola Philippines]|uniref:Uncharacterized protein n=1 Tax=Corynespora cassiicola Philippines TaxID=1448308 RepID=A0A2T2N9G2_CORCC|nr:hypothetical protein BS50DRAFT_135116 [Corynespora cassiicola Philippines]
MAGWRGFVRGDISSCLFSVVPAVRACRIGRLTDTVNNTPANADTHHQMRGSEHKIEVVETGSRILLCVLCHAAHQRRQASDPEFSFRALWVYTILP